MFFLLNCAACFRNHCAISPECAGYIDNEQFCTFIPDSIWQEKINQDGRSMFYLNAYVPGETWQFEEPLLITYADVAVGQMDHNQ